MDAAFVLRRAALIASRYDRNAKGDVLYNLTDCFHLCGLIERAASFPKSGATHRKSLGPALIDGAKAAFCRVHAVAHPSVWEWEDRRTCEQVRSALLRAYVAEQAKPNASAGSSAHMDYARTARLKAVPRLHT